MNVSLYIASRYLRSKSSNNAINFITIIAAVGVVLGAASLFIVLSGFAGLKDFTLQFSTIVDPDLRAEPSSGKSFILTEEETNKLQNISEIASFSKIIEEKAIVAQDEKNYLVTIKGVDKNFQNVTAIDSVIVQGEWIEPNTRQIVSGWGVSRNLSIGVSDFGKPVNIYVPKPGKGQITSIKSAYSSINAYNVGVFDVNETLNDNYVYAPIELMVYLLNYKPNQISNIEFKLTEGADITDAINKIQSVLGNKVVLKNKEQLNSALYKMLNTENLAVYLIFTLVLIIALFNVIGSIIMMILDKKKNLNTLYNIGATLTDIRRIFFFQGSLMSILGGVIGILIGLLLAANQLHGPEFLKVYITPTLPYPVTIKAINLFIVFITISVLGVLASKIASVRITKSLVESH